MLEVIFLFRPIVKLRSNLNAKLYHSSMANPKCVLSLGELLVYYFGAVINELCVKLISNNVGRGGLSIVHLSSCCS